MRLSAVVVLVLGLAAGACVDWANAQASCGIGGGYPGGHPGGNRLAANVAPAPNVVPNALNAKRAYANHWLHGILAAAGPAAGALRARPVSDLLMMGSHDAGTGTTEVTDIPTLRSNAWYITQTYTIADQLCLGTRFFDLRFKWHAASGQFRINHNDGYFRPANWIFADISTFLADHQHEILFLRFKVVGGTSIQTAAFWNALHVAIGANAEVHAVGGAGAAENVGARTLGSIWAPAAPPLAPDHAGGRVFILRYECEVTNPPAAAAACAGGDFGGAPAQNTHFDIGNSIWGRYSDSNDRDEIALKVWNNAPLGITDQQFIEDTHPGQLQKWRRWNAHVPVAGAKPMFAFWWTSTGAFGRTLSALDNTKKLYEDKDNKLITTGKGVGTLNRGRDPMFGLHRLYHAANDVACDAGSFVVVDFIGDSVVQKTKHLTVPPLMHTPPDMVFNFLNHVNALRIANPKVGGVWPAPVCAESYSTMLIRNIHNYNFKQIHADADADEDLEVEDVEDVEDADADEDVEEDEEAADEFEAEEEAEADEEEAEQVDA